MERRRRFNHHHRERAGGRSSLPFPHCLAQTKLQVSPVGPDLVGVVLLNAMRSPHRRELMTMRRVRTGASRGESMTLLIIFYTPPVIVAQ